MMKYLIKMVENNEKVSLIPDCYLTDEKHLEKDISKLIKNSFFTYGNPKYIQIISIMDRNVIPETKALRISKDNTIDN